MTRAEQRALEAYPIHKIGDQTSDYGEWDINRIERRSFQEGYEQAEKDLADVAQFSSGPDGFFYGKGYQQAKKDFELTWEDIVELEDLMAMVHYEFRNGIGKESFGKEVLEKFKAMKEEKE